MKIKKITIKGWRSFDEKGIVIDNLNKNNIFIGPNNSGKSNISKFFLFLKEMAKGAQINSLQEVDYKKYQHLHNNVFKEMDSWAWQKKDISCQIEVDYSDVKWNIASPYFDNLTLMTLHKAQGLAEDVGSHLYVERDGKKLLTLKQPYQVYNFESKEYIDPKYKILHTNDSVLMWENFLESLVFIDPIRHHERDSKKSDDYYFDGAKILAELKEVKSKDKPKWIKYKERIKEWLRDIINEDIYDIDIDENEYRIGLLRGKEKILSDLPELGTGVAQIVMLLSHLYLNQDKQLNIFMDEPESNLHPESVIKLIEIFDRHFANHSFFITTHSSVLIDQVNDDWSIHRIVRRNNESSQIYPCTNIVQQRELLNDLGIRASQILQSNMVIWVEGPSDAIYMKKWITDLSKGELIDGKHYSFIFYGGSNLSTHELLAEDNGLVDFLFTSRYVAIFCDTDCKSQKDFDSQAFKARVEATISRLEEMNTELLGNEKSLKDFVKIWLTEGRETENYVPVELLKKVLSDPLFKKSRINSKKGDEKTISLDVDVDKMDDTMFGKFDSFDEAFCAMYSRSDGLELSEDVKKAIALKYSNKKVSIAKEIVKLWEDKHYTDNLVTDAVEDLIAMIKAANGI